MIRIAMHGASGRMGRAITRAIVDDPDCELLLALDRDESEHLGADIGGLAQVGPIGVEIRPASSADLRGLVDVVIDFSTPDATAAIAARCEVATVPLVVGTTGLDTGAQRAIESAARHTSVVVAANTSVGVNVLLHLAAEATRLLGNAYDIEIVEMHHRRKVDAPSGTALRLAEAITAVRPLEQVHGRSGQVGARKPTEIGVLALRGGDVIGDHSVIFAGENDRIELSHRASNRALFAEGAVRAAKWTAQKGSPGRFAMSDVLGL